MNRTEIEAVIIALLKDLKGDMPNERVPISPITKPMLDLEFFDSLLALETTVELEDKLGVSFEEDSVFIDKSTAEALSISEIAERIARAHSGATVNHAQ